MSQVLLEYGKDDEKIDDLPEKSAVYAFYSVPELKGGEYICEYVGQTMNLKTRTKQHFADSEQNTELKDFLAGYKTVLVYELCKSSELEKKEEDWIAKLNPEFNKTES